LEISEPPWDMEHQLRHALAKDDRLWCHLGMYDSKFKPRICGFIFSPREWAHAGQEDPVMVYDNFIRGMKADEIFYDEAYSNNPWGIIT